VGLGYHLWAVVRTPEWVAEADIACYSEARLKIGCLENLMYSLIDWH
jgi:hypothetical protein